MEAKEKARELVDSFMSYSDYTECANFTERENQLKNAKQCALICADELKKEVTQINDDMGYCSLAAGYWEEVKKEIEKLRTP